ncbi:MAG TPA: dephospho-CoA kinase [Ignavibacteria bacterium]
MKNFKGKTVIGITGGIGSGKSMLCRMLKENGYKVIYADTLTKELYQKDKKLLQKLVETFSKDILNFKGKLILPKLKDIIFSSEKNFKKVNSIVHPVVIEAINKEINKAKEKVVIIEAALIFESGFDKVLDYVITIFSNKKNRTERIMFRDGVRKKDVDKVMKLQMDDRIKVEKSDFVVINNKTIEHLHKQAEILGKIINIIS